MSISSASEQNGQKDTKYEISSSPQSPPPNEEEDVGHPEGGWKAWSVVLGAWCAMIPAMGLLNTLGVLHAWVSTHQLQNYSESSVGWIFGAYGFFLYLAGAQAGKIRSTDFVALKLTSLDRARL